MAAGVTGRYPGDNPASMARLVSPARPLNLTDVFLDRLVREGRGGQVALIVDHGESAETYTYRELASRAAQMGHELSARGLGLEDRVFIVLEDGLDWVSAFFGALKIGCTVMFLNPEVTPDELGFYLSDSRAKGLITRLDIAGRVPAERPFLRVLLEVDDEATKESIRARPTELEAAPTTEEDFAIWLYSSGSTGAPKAAVHRAMDFVFNTERYPKEVLEMGPSDRTLSVPKLFFGYATGSNLLFPFYYGGSAVLFPDKPTPERLFQLVERHSPTMLINVPTMIAQMTELYERRAEAGQAPKLGSLRLLTSAGEALPPELYARWRRAADVEILDGIGSAEMFHVFISTRVGEVRAGSLGRLVGGYDAKIVDQEGRVCGPNEVGTLWVKGDSAAAFYWQRAEKSREVLQGGWVVSSDQFVRDEDGQFYYRGRADDLMKVGGRWLAPQEIEDALTRHPAVAEAGASGFMQEGLLKPMAFVILRAGHEATPELAKALSQHVADTTLPYKAPRFVEFVTELPRSDRDKLARPALKKLAGEAARRRGLGETA